MSLFTTDDIKGKRNEVELRANFNEGEGAYEVTGKFTLSKQEVPAGISHTQIDGPEVQAMSRA